MSKKTKRVFSAVSASALIGMYICAMLFSVIGIAHADPSGWDSKPSHRDDWEEPAIIQICEENRVAVIVEPPRGYFDVPLDIDLQDYILDICDDRGIDPAIAFAMIKCESGFRADALGDGGNSVGLMQIQPRWHGQRMEKLGCDDLTDPYQNVAVGLDLFGDLLEAYGSVENALMAYNGGGSYANRMIEEGRVSNYVYHVLDVAESMTMLEG